MLKEKSDTTAPAQQNQQAVSVAEALERGVAHHRRGEFQEAERLYRAVLQAQPENADALHLLGRLALQFGKFDVAEEYTCKAATLHPQQAVFQQTLGEIFREQGKWQESEQCFRRALERQPEHAESWAGLGQVLISRKQLDEGREASEKALQLDATSVTAMKNLALRHVFRGELPQAEARIAEALKQQANYAEGLAVLGVIRMLQKRLAEADRLLQQAVKLKPGLAEAMANRVAVLMELGQPDAALAVAQQALAVKPFLANVHLLKGKIYLQKQQANEAAQAFQKACHADPALIEAYQELGNLCLQHGKMQEAAQVLGAAVKQDPANAGIWANLGVACQALGQTGKAMEAYRKACTLAPDLIEAQHNLAALYHQSGDREAAAETYQQILARQPDNAEVLCHLATVTMEGGRLEEAVELFTRAHQLQPERGQFYLGRLICRLYLSATEQWPEQLSEVPPSLQLTAVEKAQLHIFRGIAHWATGDSGKRAEALEAYQVLREEAEQTGDVALRKNIENNHAYFQYLSRLQAFEAGHPRTASKEAAGSLALIGDSHTLSPAGRKVVFEANHYTVTPLLVMGGKAWHLAQEGMNEYKASVRVHFSNQSAGAAVLVSFGEIDCRPHEGILPYARKYGKPVEDVVTKTVNGYVDFIHEQASQYGLRAILSNVPAPNADLKRVDDKTQNQLIELVRRFNAQLQEKAEACGMEILDLYAMTAGENGWSNGTCHLDEYHLQPNVLGLALKSETNNIAPL